MREMRRDCVSQNFMDHVDIENLKKLVGDRGIWLYGTYERAKEIVNFLLGHGFKINGYVESYKDIKEYGGGFPVLKGEDIGKVKEDFLIVPLENNLQEISDMVRYNGFSIGKNLLYICEKTHVLFHGGTYKDARGNVVECEEYHEDKACRIIFSGFDNHIKIGRNSISDNLLIDCRWGGTVEIGDYLKVSEKTKFELYGGHLLMGNNVIVGEKSQAVVMGGECNISDHVRLAERVRISAKGKLEIGKGCLLGNQSDLFSHYDTETIIGEGTQIAGLLRLYTNANSNVKIGKRCMFSQNVSIISNNGHSIIDLNERENICERSHCIDISDHVWLGMNATILSDTLIEEDCVVGADSVVKGNIKSKVVVAGNPARIIRENCVWDTCGGLTYEEVVLK